MATADLRRDPRHHSGVARRGTGPLGDGGAAILAAFLTSHTGPRYSLIAGVGIGGLIFLLALGILLAECAGNA
ncbi:MAG: hypothetical protein ABW046_22760 [Actinoplanes sp.]